MENVKCEELQLELSAARKAKSASSAMNRVGGVGVSGSSGVGGTLSGIHSSSVTATGYNPSSSSVIGGGTTGVGGGGSTVTWAPTPTQHPQQGSEIDRIMAKIEQACPSLFHLLLFFFFIKIEKILQFMFKMKKNIYITPRAIFFRTQLISFS